jgi:chromosome segregation ATPase
LRKDLEDEINKSKSYQQQVERLRALVDNLDHTKEELVRRLQSTNQEKISEEHTTAVLNSDLQTYKRELLMKDQEITDLRRSIEQLDAAKDELQGELDSKTEEVAEVRAQMERQMREYT